MPCSGLNSATSFTSFAPCSRSIVVAPSRARPVWFVTRPTRLPCERREALAAQHVDARSCTGARRAVAAGAGRSEVAAGHQAGVAQCSAAASVERRRRDRRDLRAQRRDVALAVRVHAVRQEHDEQPRRRIDPERRAGEAGVAERSDRQQLAAIGRDTPSRCPSRGRGRCASPAASPASSSSPPSSGDRIRAPL